MIEAVIFDMDGLLLDSEVYWEEARRHYCASQGCAWDRDAELGVKGNNSPEWAKKIREHCELDTPVPEIIAAVSAHMRDLYENRLPLLPGAVQTVQEIASLYPTGIASSSPPDLIDFAMTEAGIRPCFSVVVSADTVGRGKPAPDVFLVAARDLGSEPSSIAVFEDSTAGILAGRAATMRVVAVPNPHYPPADDALGQADIVLQSLLDFRLEMLQQTDWSR